MAEGFTIEQRKLIENYGFALSSNYGSNYALGGYGSNYGSNYGYGSNNVYGRISNYSPNYGYGSGYGGSNYAENYGYGSNYGPKNYGTVGGSRRLEFKSRIEGIIEKIKGRIEGMSDDMRQST